MKFEKGDIVSPAKGYLGNGNVFIIKNISLDEKYYQYERKIFLQRMNEGPKINYPKDLNIDENCCKKEEKNMNTVLELYANREKIKIMNNYNVAMQNAKEEDTIQKLCKDFESQVKELAGDEANAYCFIYRLYTEETKLSFESIEKSKDIEMDKLNKKIEEIEALLDLAPDYDNKIKILRDYDIIDKKKNIML